MLAQLRDRDAAVEKLELEHQALAKDREAQREALVEARRHVEHHQRQYRHLEDLVASRDKELAAARQELYSARSHGEANGAKAQMLEAELRATQSQRDEQSRALRTFQAEARRLADDVSTRDAELASVRRDLDTVLAEREAQQAQLHRLQVEMRELHLEHDAKLEAIASAQHRAELLNAKCQNLEAALTNATSKQADLAMEREAHRERAERLEEQLRRGHELPPQDGRTKLVDTNWSGISTAASTIPASPRLPHKGLPPLRPPSASKLSPKEKRDIMIHSGLVCKNP